VFVVHLNRAGTASFAAGPTPRWRWRFDDTVIEKSLRLVPGHAALVATWRLVAGGPARLSVAPLITAREPHQLLRETAEFRGAAQGIPGRVRLETLPGQPTVTLWHNGGFMPARGWARLLGYPLEFAAEDDGFDMTELRTRYAKAEKVILVCDNLNTHTKGAFYEAFSPEQAREILRRLTFRYTPKHGSWLNIAENELSSMTRQCLDRRIGDIEVLRQETQAWDHASNKKQRGVDWQFKIDDARVKLKSLYPKILD